MAAADVVIALGCKFGQFTTHYWQQPRADQAVIHVDIDGEEIGRAIAVRLGIVAAARETAGAFARSLRILQDLQRLGLPAQVGATLSRHNAKQLHAIAGLVSMYGIRIWNVFYLVPTGRGKRHDMVDVDSAEASWRWLAEFSETAPFTVRTTAAPQFRRVQLERALQAQGPSPRLAGAGYAIRPSRGGLTTRGVNDGKGFLFIDRVGNLCPSGFLQLAGGNIREDEPGDTYRQAPLFRRLRDTNALTGECGRCRFAELCGGSRARACGVTGSYLADDPLCALAQAPGQAQTQAPAHAPAPAQTHAS